MLDNNKISLMTKLAIYEKDEGEDIKLSKYFKMDYLRYQIIKSVVSVTVSYLILLIIIAFYKSEYLIQEAVKLDYKAIGAKVLGIYIILLTIYVFSSIVGYSLKFDSSRKRLFQYRKNLKQLRQYYIDEENELK
ncbi:hypothetical protein [Anaerosporobacter faecicola]|uniref:hypothetical protein n=1 Tax=Anaerosporobacter faecicola TaxID=2718714 RepID=UPI0014394B82|nr:hypothetical protein [Anaerosporobacter faecicola]